MKLAEILIVIVLIMGGIGYWYYQESQSRIETLKEDSARFEVAAETNQSTIDKMNLQAAKNQRRITELSENLQDAEQYNKELRKILQKHNLTILAEEKPGLIEKRINEATNEVFDSIMSDTGAR